MSEKNEEKESGSHKDNDLSHVQKVMKDNDIPVFYSIDKDDE